MHIPNPTPKTAAKNEGGAGQAEKSVHCQEARHAHMEITRLARKCCSPFRWKRFFFASSPKTRGRLPQWSLLLWVLSARQQQCLCGGVRERKTGNHSQSKSDDHRRGTEASGHPGLEDHSLHNGGERWTVTKKEEQEGRRHTPQVARVLVVYIYMYIYTYAETG